MTARKSLRRALLAYGALLVLPTLVLGVHSWLRLVAEHEAQITAAPRRAADAARRLVEVMRARLERIVDAEERRPYHEYAPILYPHGAIGDELVLQSSPLLRERPPEGVLGWFEFDRADGPDGPIDLYVGDVPDPAERAAELEPIVRGFRERKDAEGFLRRAAQLGELDPLEVPLLAAAIHKSRGELLECIADCRELMRDETVELQVSRLHLELYVEEDGTPRAVASRRVLHHGKRWLPARARCLKPLVREGIGTYQGILLDPAWLLRELPEEAARSVLGEVDRLVLDCDRCDPVDPEAEVAATVLPVEGLGLAAEDPEARARGAFQVAVSYESLRRSFESERMRFLGLAAMLALSLATGMVLLHRSVGRELEQAERTENFVSAVTHELRTPLASIRLHGEMLLDGWAHGEARRREYHRRILRDSRRLSTLVERVLEKARIGKGGPATVAGDLNALVRELEPELAAARPDGGGADDLVLDLAPDLPPVLLAREAVAGILLNLVENARKYAPYRPDVAGSEPIRVATRRERDGVVLEVADRGPGVPPAERERVFEAFHRIGDEATRTAPGTGLGLHLVRLHAESVGGEACCLPRPGGGSLFQVRLRRVSVQPASDGRGRASGRVC